MKRISGFVVKQIPELDPSLVIYIDLDSTNMFVFVVIVGGMLITTSNQK